MRPDGLRAHRRAEAAARQHRPVRARELERGRRRARPRAARSRASCGASAREIGIQGLPVPEAVRRQRRSTRSPARSRSRRSATAAATAASSSRCAPTCSPAWCRSGSTAAKRRSSAICPGLCDGTLVGVHAMTEPDSGSTRSRCARAPSADGAGLRINGTQDVHLERAGGRRGRSCSR